MGYTIVGGVGKNRKRVVDLDIKTKARAKKLLKRFNLKNVPKSDRKRFKNLRVVKLTGTATYSFR